MGSDPEDLRRPLVERVGLLLLVAGAFRQLDEATAVALVEPASSLVALEDPEPNAVRTFALHDVEQRAPDSARLVLRTNVEMSENISRERGEADDAPRVLRDPHIV